MAAAEAAARAGQPYPGQPGYPPAQPGQAYPGGMAGFSPPAVPMAFTGLAGRLFGLLTAGFFLQLLTLGIYRFWLITDVRRYYWSNTTIGMEQIAYTGRGLELFKGFLVALAILVPLKAGAFFLALGLPQAETVISIAVFLILIFLGQFAAYAGRRYRLARTSWRGLRFRMTGSAWAYGAKAFGLSLVVIATLGLAFPWTTAYLERLKMRETWYGDVQGDFTGAPFQLFKSGILIWALGFGLPVLMVFQALSGAPSGFFAALLHDALQGDFSPRGPVAVALMALTGAVGLSLLVGALLFPAFQAVLFRWRMNGTRLGGAGLASTFRIGTSYRVYVLGALAIGGSMILFSLAMAVVLGSLAYSASGLVSSRGTGVAGVVFVVLAYLLSFGAFWIAKQVFIDVRLQRARMASLAVLNIAALDGVAARNVDASAMGDSLGDAVDIGIGL
jgi:uncharacterized membrane protein YjgN (DUF898 family)